MTSPAAASPSSISKKVSHAGEFTPGPWSIDGTPWLSHSCCYDFAITGYTAGKKETIAEVLEEANARLIAAAPELLAELIALLNWAQAFGAFRDDVGEGVERHVRDLISKATGA